MPQIQSHAQSLLPRKRQPKKSPRRLSVSESLQNLARNTFHLGRRNPTTTTTTTTTTTATAMPCSSITPVPSTRSVSCPSGSPAPSTLRTEPSTIVLVTPKPTRVPTASLHNPKSRIPTPMPLHEPLRKASISRLNGRERRVSQKGARISSTNSVNGQQKGTTQGNTEKAEDAGTTPAMSQPRRHTAQGCASSPRSKITRGNGLPAASLTLPSTSPGTLGRMKGTSQAMRNQNLCTNSQMSPALKQQQSNLRLTPLSRRTTPIDNSRTASAVKARCTPQHQSLQPFGNQLPKAQSMGNMLSYDKPPTIHILSNPPIEQCEKSCQHRSRLSIREKVEDIENTVPDPPKANDKGHIDDKNDTSVPVNAPDTSTCPIPPKRPSNSTNIAPEDVRMVATAEPHQYWLGRFTTLTNAYRYEESFSEPDTVTGYSRPRDPHHHATQSTTDGKVEDQRTIRVLIFLERACTTEEAKTSFIEFRNAYSKKYGGKWVKSLSTGDEKLTAMKKVSGSFSLKANTISSMRDMHKEQRKSIEFGAAGGMALMNVFRTMRRSLA